MNKLMIAALAATSMVAMAVPANAATATGTINITGHVTGTCSVQPVSEGNTFGSTVDLGELDAPATGLLESSTVLASRFVASSALVNFRVVCNTGNPTVAVDATELTNGVAAPTGFASRVDYTAHVALTETGHANETVSNSSLLAPTGATALGGRLATTGNNISVTADTFSTANATDVLTVGNYTGSIVINIAPGA